MNMAKQNVTLENPEVREPTVDSVDEKVTAQVSPAQPDYAVDLNKGKAQVSEKRVVLDETVAPNDPNAVIVPPEGRGTTDLPIDVLSQPSPEALLASGDAPEATGVEDGVEKTADKS
jgi:hypothetical protein